MEFFPLKPSFKQTKHFIEQMKNQFESNGFCYYAVEELKTKQCIGFIGISEQTYLKEPKKFVDIGWRLHQSHWNRGFATEGALACLNFAFHQLKIREIFSVASETNKRSEHVMQKIGIDKIGTFLHPKLSDAPNLQSCVLYKITKEKFST